MIHKIISCGSVVIRHLLLPRVKSRQFSNVQEGINLKKYLIDLCCIGTLASSGQYKTKRNRKCNIEKLEINLRMPRFNLKIFNL